MEIEECSSGRLLEGHGHTNGELVVVAGVFIFDKKEAVGLGFHHIGGRGAQPGPFFFF